MTLYSIYRRANLVSLDVVAGAVSSCLFFSHVLGTPVTIFCPAALAICVWGVYTVDHLRDALMSPTIPSTARHVFHLENAISLFAVVLLTIPIALVIVFFLPWHTIQLGAGLALGVITYLCFQRRLRWSKEIVVAVFYAAGVVIGSGAQVDEILDAGWLLLAFMLMALLNLLMFSWFDYFNDLRDGHRSAVTVLGRRRGAFLICSIFLLLSILAAPRFTDVGAIVILLMAFCHLVIFLFHSYFALNDRFRIVGDAIFFLPVIAILL